MRQKPLPPAVQDSLTWLEKRLTIKPTLALILGSGLGDFANQLKSRITIPMSDIPNYPNPTVEGHKGKLVVGVIGKTTVLAFQGRVHIYEQSNLERVLFPIYVAYGIGVKALLVTNAAGGVNRYLQPGDLMIITDQINLTFENPLRQKHHYSNDAIYDKKIQSLIELVAAEKSIPVRRGVYCGVKGPSYETAAEVRMIQRVGGDAVGMSTVNEVSLAASLGMKVGGISCITNQATGISQNPLSHSDVALVAKSAKKRFGELVREVIARL